MTGCARMWDPLVTSPHWRMLASIGLGVSALLLALSSAANAIEHVMPDDAIGAFRVNETTNGGFYLTDSRGLTVYTYDGDPPGKATCLGACGETWPPVLAEANDRGFDPLAVITREDGLRQWTFLSQREGYCTGPHQRRRPRRRLEPRRRRRPRHVRKPCATGTF